MAAKGETVRSANSGLASSEPRTLAEVDRLLARVPVALTDALGDTLIGVYLFGSLVTGDFEPEASDIDIAAVIATDLDHPTFDRLLSMHRQLERVEPRWLNRIDVFYLTPAQLARFDPATTIAVISPGEPFHRRQAEHGLIFNLQVLRESGRTLLGPPPRALIGEISEAELAVALRQRVIEWRAWADDGLADAGAADQAFSVLTMCRALTRHRLGASLSKKAAAEAIAAMIPARRPLIEESLAQRYRGNDPPSNAADLACAAVAFVHEVAGLILNAEEHGKPSTLP